MTFLTRARLDEALRAVCPIHGTSGDFPDVRIDFDPSATAPQIAAAQSALASFDQSAGAQATWDAQQSAKTIGRWSGVRKTSDQAVTSAAFVDVADCEFQLAPNSHYKFRFVGAYTTALAATGLHLSVNGPASPAFIRFIGQIHTTAATVFGGAAAAYDVAIANTASGGATPLPFVIEGSISTGAVGGTFRLRARSETNGSAVNILRGTIGELAAVA